MYPIFTFYQWLIQEELIEEEELSLSELTDDLNDILEDQQDDEGTEQSDNEDLPSQNHKSSN